MHTLRTTLVLLAALFCGPAFAEDTSTNDGVAQDDGDDDLGDILGGPSDSEQSSEEEARDFASGNTGSTIGARNEDVQLVEGDGEKKRLIKTIQRKNFLKLGRLETSPYVGFVTNDPFINRYLLGGGFGYHITETPVHVHDLHATMLHLLGIDHERLTFRFQGRDYRLTDVSGRVVGEALA